MCLAVPMKLIKINGVTGIAELGNPAKRNWASPLGKCKCWGLCDRPRRLRHSETG